jgi:hypothetical protein
MRNCYLLKRGLCSTEFAGSDVVRFPSAYNGNELSLNDVLAFIKQ